MGGARVPAFFEERMSRIHKQLAISIQKMIDGEKLSWLEIFGTAIPSGTQTHYRSKMLSAGLIQPASENIRGGPFFKLMVKDLVQCQFLIKDQINVATLFWSDQLGYWQEQMASTGAPDLMTAEALAYTKEKEATHEISGPVTENDFSKVNAAADAMSAKIIGEAREITREGDEIAAGNLKLLHATAENMIYLRERLDGLINNPPAPMPVVMVGHQWMSEIQKQIQRTEEKVDRLLAIWETK